MSAGAAPEPDPTGVAAAGLDAALAPGGITSLYQPVVDLETGCLLGFEALARGASGSAVEHPRELFAAAKAAGRSADLDWACRAAALSGALEAGLGNASTLFVDIEGETDNEPVPEHLDRLLTRAARELRVIVEITESVIVEQPAKALAVVEWARNRSWGVALDDIGADPTSLAMMPFLEPDVVKVDLSLVEPRPNAAIGQVVSAVLSQAERSGARVLAEGIETEAHRDAALAMGATLGQGWLFGHPAPLPLFSARPIDTIPLRPASAGLDDVTPFSVIRSARPLRRAGSKLITDLARHLEEQALAWQESPVILSTFRPDEPFDDAVRERYEQLAAQGCFVVAIGTDLTTARGPSVHTARIPIGHRLNEERALVLVGPHYTGALVARSAGGADYDFAVTHDRDLVVEAGRALLRAIGAPDVELR